MFKKENVVPAAYLNQNIEVITSGFKAGRLDAAVIWEPTASRLVQEGLAKRIASGTAVNEKDGGYMVMRFDLIKQRPDVVKAWLSAELDAQLFLADSKNAQEVTRMAREQTTGFSERILWAAMYGQNPEAAGGVPVRLTLPYGVTSEEIAFLNTATTFLHSIKSINVDKLRPEAIMPEFTAAILKERGLSSPIGRVMALPVSEFKGR